jgi:hypothetical protein
MPAPPPLSVLTVALALGVPRAPSVCHAFPDDEMRTDSLIVALISLAVSLPVSHFLASCFEVANDSEAPESWLEWSGTARWLLGRKANRLWNYTGERGQPARLVRWWIRSSGAPAVEMLVNLAHMLLACCPTRLPWVRRIAEEDDAADDVAAASSAVHELLIKKHAYTAVGLTGLYLVWAVFTWRVSPLRGAARPARPRAHHAGSRRSVAALTPHAAPRLNRRRRVQVHLRLRRAHIPPSGRGRGGVVCALLGRQLWHRQRIRVQRRRAGGG